MPDALRTSLTLALLPTLAVPAALPAGRCRLRARHPDYPARVFEVGVPAPGDVTLDVSL